MRTLCFFIVFGVFSTGCSSCDDKDQVAPALESQKPGTNPKAIRLSPAARKLFDESGAGDAAP